MSAPRRLGRSAAALFVGFLAVVVASLGTEQLLGGSGFHLSLAERRWSAAR